MEPQPKLEVRSRDSPDPVTPPGSFFRDVNNFIFLHFPPHVNIYTTDMPIMPWLTYIIILSVLVTINDSIIDCMLHGAG